jgi:hypothetical protein
MRQEKHYFNYHANPAGGHDSTQDVHHPPGLAKGVNRQVEQTWESLSISKKLQDDNKNTEASQRVF